MLKSVPQIYTSKIFFDDYPPNIIRLWRNLKIEENDGFISILNYYRFEGFYKTK